MAEVVVLSRTAIQDVIAAERVEAGEQVEDVCFVPENAAVVSIAGVDPVVAGSTDDRLGPLTAIHDEVVPRASEELISVVAADHEVVPVAADEEVCAEPGPGLHGVIAGAAFQDVVAVVSEEDIVAVATDQRVVAFATTESVVSSVPE